MSDTKPVITLRLGEVEQQLIDALRKKTGASARSEILRMGLHALAAQHGLKP